MDDSAKLLTAQQYLRMKYTGQVPALRALADKIAEGAFEAVTLTGQQFEGGSHQGQLVFPAMLYLQAVLQLIAELDPDNTPVAPCATVFPDFSARPADI